MSYWTMLLFLLLNFNSVGFGLAKDAPTTMIRSSLLLEKVNQATEDKQQRVLPNTKSRVRTSVWENEVGCGKANIIKSKKPNVQRIINGTAAVRGQWPWQAMILRYYDNIGDFSLACGGTLIKRQWVLTASHCFNGEASSHTHVVLGTNLKDHSETSAKLFAVASIICHQDYVGSANSFKNDICLIKLPSEAVYTNYIRPGCLPQAGSMDVEIGDICVITGWGVTKGTGSNDVLREAKVEIISKSQCSSWYAEDGVSLPDDHFCAGYQKGQIDTCQGDSGGPLECKRTTSKTPVYVVYGITSFGIGCAERKRPGVYTNVAKYTDWVADIISGHQYATDQCFSRSTLHVCGSSIAVNGTVLHTPVVDTETWIYPSNSKCSWNIQGPTGTEIRLEFLCFFHVEIDSTNANQCYDYMAINAQSIGFRAIYCGTSLLAPFTIKSSQATLTFSSDGSVQSSGFVVRITFVEPPQTTTQRSRTTKQRWSSIAKVVNTEKMFPLNFLNTSEASPWSSSSSLHDNIIYYWFFIIFPFFIYLRIY